MTAKSTAPACYALLTDVTPNRGTVVTTGTEDDCRDAATDDRQEIARVVDDEPAVGERVTVWRVGAMGAYCGLR